MPLFHTKRFWWYLLRENHLLLRGELPTKRWKDQIENFWEHRLYEIWIKLNEISKTNVCNMFFFSPLLENSFPPASGYATPSQKNLGKKKTVSGSVKGMQHEIYITYIFQPFFFSISFSFPQNASWNTNDAKKSPINIIPMIPSTGLPNDKDLRISNDKSGKEMTKSLFLERIFLLSQVPYIKIGVGVG